MNLVCAKNDNWCGLVATGRHILIHTHSRGLPPHLNVHIMTLLVGNQDEVSGITCTG